MTFGDETFVSPWSVRLESNQRFVLSTKAPSAIAPFPPAPSFSTASYSGYVTRADECRLLFLSRSDRHVRLPLVQWKPFGSTPLEDADLEVRNHAGCEGHMLYYQGFEWDVHEVSLFSQIPTLLYSLISLLSRLLAKDARSG